jgi:hypothetical protein
MDDVASHGLMMKTVSYWKATPDDYSSIRVFQFQADGAGELTYAYGQTIYAVVPCIWELPEAGRIRLTYSAPTAGRLAAGFVFEPGGRIRELGYKITRGSVSGIESVVARPYKYDLTLEFAESPWPAGMDVPYGVPKVFYGTLRPLVAAEQVAAPDGREDR